MKIRTMIAAGVFLAPLTAGAVTAYADDHEAIQSEGSMASQTAVGDDETRFDAEQNVIVERIPPTVTMQPIVDDRDRAVRSQGHMASQTTAGEEGVVVPVPDVDLPEVDLPDVDMPDVDVEPGQAEADVYEPGAEAIEEDATLASDDSETNEPVHGSTAVGEADVGAEVDATAETRVEEAIERGTAINEDADMSN